MIYTLNEATNIADSQIPDSSPRTYKDVTLISNRLFLSVLVHDRFKIINWGIQDIVMLRQILLTGTRFTQ